MLKPLCSPFGSSELQTSTKQQHAAATAAFTTSAADKDPASPPAEMSLTFDLQEEKNNYTSQTEPFPLKKKYPIPQGRKYELALTLLGSFFWQEEWRDARGTSLMGTASGGCSVRRVGGTGTVHGWSLPISPALQIQPGNLFK